MSQPSESLRMGKRPQNSKNKRRWRVSSSKGPHLDAVRNDINVTPLVDVMLVLLIIFMLMTLIMGRGADVRVPTGQKISEEEDKGQPVVSVDPGGILYVEKQKIGPAVDQGVLKEMNLQVNAIWDGKGAEAGRRVYLKADTNVPYETVFPVLEYLHKEMNLESIDIAVARQEN